MSDNLHDFNDEVLEQDQIITDLTALTTTVNTNTTNITTINNLNIANKFAGSVSSGLKTLIEGNDTDIANIKTKTDFISVTQNVDLDTIESNVSTNNAKNSYPSADATKVGRITIDGNLNLTNMNNSITTNTNAIDAVELKTDFITITSNQDLDVHGTQITTSAQDITLIKNNTLASTLKTNVDANTAKNSYPSADATKMGHITITSAQDLDVHGTQITTSATDITGIKNNTLASTLKTAVDANSAKVSMVIGTSSNQAMAGNTTTITSQQATDITTNNAKLSFPSTLNSLLSVTDTYELEVGSGAGIPRIRLNGQNGVSTSSEIIFIDATGSNAEYRGGFSIRMNSAANELQFMSDLNNDNNPEEALAIDRATKKVSAFNLCVYRNEIEAEGTSNKSIMITSKIGGLPGYPSDYYPVVKTPYNNMYFSTNGAYNAYLGDTNVGGIDFTAQHKAVPVNNNLINDLSNNIGKIVISNGEISSLIKDNSGIFHATTGKNGITINEAIPKILLSNSYKDKRIFGVISDGTDNEPNGEKHYKTGAFTSVIHSDISDNRLFINSGGEGAILVSDICGNIENGDLITTSILEGIGCKQDDDLIHSYTIAKATIDCNFDLNSNNYNCYLKNGNKIAFISCIYLL